MAKSDKKSRLLTIIIIAVLGAWAAAMGAFFARSRLKSAPVVITQGPKAAGWDREQWMGIYQGRTKIGYAFSRLRQTDAGFELWSKTRIELKLMDTAQRISIDLQGRLDPDYTLRDLGFEALSDFMDIKARGHRDGNDLDLVITTAGQEIRHTLHFEHPPTLEMQWQLQQAMTKAKIGDEFSLSMFDPMSQKDLPVTVKVTGDEDLKIGDTVVPCFKAEIAVAGQSEYAWVSKQDAEVVKEYHPGSGFTMISEGQEKALDVDWEKAGAVDVLVTLMVPSNTALIEPRSITYMKARLTGAPLDNLDLASPGRQAVAGSTVEIKLENAMPATGYALPVTASLPDDATLFYQWLAPTAFIQSDNAQVKKAALKAAAGAADAVTATDRLAAWVAKNVEPSMVMSIPSALEVLDQKKGACKEHTVLFVALARSLGIPARTVSGIVYSDQQMLEGFYYHAWVEVWLADPEGNGAWVSVDPTFGQNPADATHVKMVEGGLDQMYKLLQVVGRLKVEVEDYR
ncbi:MAG TPA: transglutaminase-like domain-containing protein [bacterium]|nr:transglutaminase-like domain-containing protein [bacterium]